MRGLCAGHAGGGRMNQWIKAATLLALTLLFAVLVFALALYLGSGSGDEFRDHLQKHEQAKQGLHISNK